MIHHPDEVYFSTVSIESYVNVTFTSCTFSGNQGSAVYALQTDIFFYGNNTFHKLEVEIPSTLPCFFQALTEDEEDFLNTIQVTFISNTAGSEGSSLYGGYLDECHGMGLSISGLSIFKKIFYYNSSSDLSIQSTDPTSVCFCLGSITLKPLCQRQNWSYTRAVYPGETFSIPAVLVGQINGTVPGVVHSTLRDSSASLGELQSSQRINKAKCTLLNYSVFTLKFSLCSLRRCLSNYYANATVLIFKKKCPPAFILAPVSWKCDYAPILVHHHAKCYIDNQTILALMDRVLSQQQYRWHCKQEWSSLSPTLPFWLLCQWLDIPNHQQHRHPVCL